MFMLMISLLNVNILFAISTLIPITYLKTQENFLLLSFVRYKQKKMTYKKNLVMHKT